MRIASSHNSSVRLRHIVGLYTLHAVIHQIGLNILFCADRFQTNIDGILNGSYNYIVHSYYNRSIADVQLYVRLVSCVYELVSIIETANNRILVTSLSPKRN